MLALVLAAALAPSLAPSPAPPALDAAAAGKQAVAVLTRYAFEGDPEARAIVAAAWGQIGNQAALPLLRKATKDHNIAVRIEAATSLHKLGDDPSAKATLEAIIVKASTEPARSARDQYRDIARDKARAKAILRLADFGGEDAANLFEKTLQDPSPVIRDATSVGLAHMGLDEFAAPFLDATHSSDESVRTAAARSLGAIGQNQYVAALKQLAGDTSADVRLAAVEALSSFDGSLTAATFADAMRDADPRVRSRALWALSRIADPDTKALLQKTLNDSRASDVILECEAGLALRGEKVDLSFPANAFRLKDADLKALALEVLKAAPGDDATRLLQSVMDGERDTRLKLWAATALVKRLQRRGA